MIADGAIDARAPGRYAFSVAKEWLVYIVRCRDGSLYTGVTKDLGRRVAAHNAGKGAAYTRSRRPVRARYKETGFTYSQALVREAEIKRLPREKKKELLAVRPLLSKLASTRGQTPC